MWIVFGVISVVAIVTDYLHKQAKLKIEATREEIELERLKQENFMLETEKIRMEIEHTRQQLSLDNSYEKTSVKEIK
ncbi:hypothetical protein CD29_05485 [Ureibacillus manganicus DSM 26584]|uniref:Uncharacterized protein n=2 Tax=Ureibacillus TaxID=160795 RepID=A0A0A3I426_9BACL|nr:hypothetical protein CD29_05485 [Ureibacillus manganicus DSM 26584]